MNKLAAPLDDILVIEIDSWMAAPSAGAILADLGAEVIKIEPLSGDPMRGKQRPAKVEGAAGKYDFQFDVDNRGKKSLTVALDRPEGAELVRRLVGKAQIFMCNLLPQRQEKFGLDPDTLLKIKPDLVHATLTGYGTRGPDAWRPGYDVTAFFGRSGLYDSMREGDHGEVPMARPAQGDHTTGLAMVGAILAALRMVERTGEGQAVETSLYETAVWTQASDFGVTAVDRAPVRRRARQEMLIALGNRFPCGDDKWVVFNMPEPAPWKRFCEVIDKSEWIDNPDFATPSDRYRNMNRLVAGIDEALRKKTRDEWGRIFDAEGFIWGPVLSLDEVASDPQAEAIGLFPELVHPEFGTYRTVAIPMHFKNASVSPKTPAPMKGEHTREILLSAGVSEEEIRIMIDRGVVGTIEQA